ncbi:class I SAM-dependent rRNA methyltransferase [Portibacter lacus]|uniref:SAM-dependent methyltransferase n=1 Tax=Portibacter lacus TaxID=1099794 RepID=A0AA37WE79_9BACT|nr:class I SAM-dependent rRNA methyltransferase [Portibacter lacus]GLR16782.1 SAM-dependent methyltransferase [Portibacter lacus]
MNPIVKIKNDRIASIKRKHPWIFSRGVIDYDHCEEGDIVEIQSQKGDFQAIGYFQEGSIMLRILSFEKIEIDQKFWDDLILKAINLRKSLNLPSDETNAFRLFHGEGDGASGLIIDRYNNAVVIQCHTTGIHRQIDLIKKSIEKHLPEISIIYDKSKNVLPDPYSRSVEDEFLKGESNAVQILENGHKFQIELIESQKTGFFLDQRDNRKLLGEFAKGKSVLNLYCYTGGFSIYALNNSAKAVCSIDSSKKAIAMLNENVALTGKSSIHESLTEDVNQYLKQIKDDEYDIIVVDPPAFAKNQRKKHNAVQAYKRVNKAAIDKVKKGGMIFTFSCSQVIDVQLFQDTITAAAIESGRDCQILYRMSQGADHPVNIFHPEGKYLKGLVLKVQ